MNTAMLLDLMKSQQNELGELVQTKFTDMYEEVISEASFYEFPTLSLNKLAEEGNFAELLRQFEIQVIDLVTEESYWIFRDQFCSLSIALNKTGNFPPVFRSMPKALNIEVNTELQKLMLMDGIVIDCHWLHMHGDYRLIVDEVWKKLFPQDLEFSFFNASRYAAVHLLNQEAFECMADRLISRRSTQSISISPCVFI